MDASAKTIDMSTNIVKDGAPAAAAILDTSIAVPQTSDEVRRLRANSDVLGMSNLPPSEADMMTYLSVRANDLTNLGLTANAPNGAMKGNEDEVAAAAKSPVTVDTVAIPAPLFAKPDGTVSSINLSVDGRFEARISV